MGPPKLIDFDGNRDNNFTAIRITLAWFVLYGHSFAVSNVSKIHDPLNQVFQDSIWIGRLAVFGFFAISGYLVTASFVKRGIIDYSVSRILRIFPALIICVLLLVFVLGPVATNLNLKDYFSNDSTFSYLRNALALHPLEYNLPGVFEENPFKNAVNGSLWSIPLEVRCYLLLMIIGWFGFFRDKIIANICILSIFVFGYYFFSDIPLIGLSKKWPNPSLFFLLGVFFYINRRHIYIDGKLAILASFLAYTSFGEDWFFYVFPVSFVYLIFYLAYVSKELGLTKRLGDISYGLYIYAWPMQQIVASLDPTGTPYSNTFWSSILTIIFAYISWIYIEKPALQLKQKILGTSKCNYFPFTQVVSKLKKAK